MRKIIVPRISDVLFVAVFAGCLLLGQRMLNTDGDLGRHLTLGDYILNTHTIPISDILSWTRAGQPRPAYEWLAQVLFALADRLLTLDGVVILASLVITTSFLISYLDGFERTRAPIIALTLTVWAAVASSLHWLARPHVFSFLFFALWIRGLEHVRTGKPPPIWQFPLLMLIWANTHGAFVFGFLAWAAYGGGWLWNLRKGNADRGIGCKLLLVGVTSLAASLLTPDLWQNWAAVLRNRSAYILSRTVETMPPNLLQAAAWPFFCLLALALLLLLLNGRRVEPPHVLLLVGFGVASLAIARNIPFFALAAGPVLTLWLSAVLDRRTPWAPIELAFANLDAALFGWILPAVTFLAALGFFIYHSSSAQTSIFRFDPAIFPVHAADWVESHGPAGRMFNDLNWGGYLLYRLWPSQHVFIDSQSDFYGEQFVRQYASILGSATQADLQFNRYDVGWIMIPPAARLAGQMRQDPRWHVAYQDPTALVLIRNEPQAGAPVRPTASPAAGGAKKAGSDCSNRASDE